MRKSGINSRLDRLEDRIGRPKPEPMTITQQQARLNQLATKVMTGEATPLELKIFNRCLAVFQRLRQRRNQSE